ncbi:SAM-dependent methyltransferase [Coraliomargarita sinensis]|uniref:SAM-dependent methyltransferase n=1 Tax=Coraliomargarita sinensis TaxID=2174842 RepID=A0A317ZF42_9BACT|nr:cyclopropane-fatty-acyl-phospholipid synthase family protein [Coraliomargarita sinensis]PXA03920.1 SAM-dependent methyltransferase [Coraliomargarita sinensis]
MSISIKLAEHGLLPDSLIRTGIRKLLSERLKSARGSHKTDSDWIKELSAKPLAEETDAANEQHYEIPAPYFQTVLGEHLKYSCGYWPDEVDTLDASEAAMLKLSCERAELDQDQDILELGCGWGSLSLWMAEHYPQSRITSISNSHSQRKYIEQRAKERGLENLQVVTCDINDFKPEGHYDRVVSVEMFEHVRNHRKLFTQIENWLRPGGKCFVHIFSHQSETYLFEARGPKDWMSRYFFSGGIMPSSTLLISAAEGILNPEEKWFVNGNHYSRTLEAWLQKQDANREDVLQTFRECYGSSAKLWYQRWRIFYMACSELFAYNEGREWPVMHYRFVKA